MKLKRKPCCNFGKCPCCECCICTKELKKLLSPEAQKLLSDIGLIILFSALFGIAIAMQSYASHKEKHSNKLYKTWSS